MYPLKVFTADALPDGDVVTHGDRAGVFISAPPPAPHVPRQVEQACARPSLGVQRRGPG